MNARYDGGRREIDVAARLVRLGFERESKRVPLIARVLAQEVDGVAKPLDGFDRVLRRVDFCAFAPAPEDVGLRAQLHAQIHRPHRLLQGVGAHAGVVRRERAVLEHRIGEQVRRRHRHGHAGGVERLPEIPDDAIALGGGGIDRDEVVVVEVDAIGAELGEPVHRANRIERRPHEFTERIAAAIADGPESERELVCGSGCEPHGSAVEVDVRRRDQEQHDRRVDHVPVIPASARLATLLAGDGCVGQSGQSGARRRRRRIANARSTPRPTRRRSAGRSTGSRCCSGSRATNPACSHSRIPPSRA